jgi:DNA polymerase alpha subunit A
MHGKLMMFRYVLDQILSGEATEVVVDNIHEYLTTIGQNVRDGKVRLDDFIVFKVVPHPRLLM